MRRSLKAILFSIPIWLLCISSAGALDARLPFRAFVLDNWSVEQGLPQITALSITQDRTGYLWIGTQLAIARFDGVRFTTFDRAAAGVDTSMNGAAWADRKDQVWFGGAQGLLRERDGRFSALGGGAVNAIIDAGDDSPLLATSHGVARVAGDRIVPVAGFDGAAYSLLREGAALWIGGSGRLCRLAISTTQPANCIPLPGARGQPPAITHLARAYGTLWLGTHAGLMRLDGNRIAAAGIDAELDDTPIESLYAGRAGVLWIGTVDALYRYLPDGTLEKLAEADLARDPWIHALFEDRDGNLWLGSHTEGLYRVWNGWARRVSTRDGLTDPFVWSVARAPDGSILFGTNSGVDRFDGKLAHLLVAGSALPNPSAYELYYDHRGRLWIGTRAGIALYDQARNITPPALDALSAWQINDIHEVADDDFWIGTSGGLYRWRDGALSRADAGASVAAARIRTILPLASDHLLIGTEDGVREYQNGKLTQPAWAAPLHGRFVSRLVWLQPGMLGLATMDAGVGVMQNGHLRMTTSKDGLPSDNAWTLDVVGGQLYAASIAGVWRLPLEQLPVPGSPPRHVAPQLLVGQGREGSMQHLRCCNGGAGARSLIDDDAIWYSTVSGALRLDIAALGPHPQPPVAVIESVEYDHRNLPAAPLEVNNGPRDLSIQYTAPWLRIEALHFRYRLEGYDAGWQEAGDRRAAFYTHLPPGHYRFRVAAGLSGDGRFGPEADLPIDIVPYWYERNIVRAVAAVLLALIALILVRWLLRAQRRRNAYLEAQVTRRTDQLARANERLRVANLALAEESHTDALTTLHNRRHLLTRLPGLLAGGARVGVMLIDLDDFKLINDRHGHVIGDNVLGALGRLLAATRRTGDLTVRWGGEEFLLLLNDVDAASVLAIAQRLRNDIAAQIFDDKHGGRIPLTCSIGFSLHPVATTNGDAPFEVTLELADLALYRAKRDGRDTCIGLVAAAPLPADAAQRPMAAQLEELLASGKIIWMQDGR